MKMYLFLSIVTLFIFSLFITSTAEASEGIVELENVNKSNARCFAMSTLLNRSTNYQLLIRCQNLIYPIEPKEEKFYILWANSSDNATIIRLGELQFGKATFKAKTAFSGLFVTKEQTQSPGKPSTNRVMEGKVEPFSFLEPKPSSAINLSPTIIQKPTVTITPTPQPQSRGISPILSIIFIIIFIIVIFSIIVFIIYRIRKSER